MTVFKASLTRKKKEKKLSYLVVAYPAVGEDKLTSAGSFKTYVWKTLYNNKSTNVNKYLPSILIQQFLILCLVLCVLVCRSPASDSKPLFSQ